MHFELIVILSVYLYSHYVYVLGMLMDSPEGTHNKHCAKFESRSEDVFLSFYLTIRLIYIWFHNLQQMYKSKDMNEHEHTMDIF